MISEEFKQYADFSVRVDRFFNIVNIYGTHNDSLKFMHSSLPDREKVQIVINNDTIDREIRNYLLISANTLRYMATTGIFLDSADTGAIDTENIRKDMLNFSFYTCYCFQWTLFENFVRTMVYKIIDNNAISDTVREKLEKRRGTKEFLDFINSGSVFGESPFVTVLPVMGWIPTTEICDYSELNKIRMLRNNFVHGIETPEITSEDFLVKYDHYQRSMWILRKFAENVQFMVQEILNSQSTK